MDSLNIHFVQRKYKLMAVNPDFLKSSRKKVKAVKGKTGKLERMTKQVIAVSAVKRCDF